MNAGDYSPGSGRAVADRPVPVNTKQRLTGTKQFYQFLALQWDIVRLCNGERAARKLKKEGV